MAEIKLSFDLTFSRRFITAAGAAAMMLCAVPELDSESVTLSTYYPAPSGVYTNMITTANTYLARDGGNVGIRTTGPTTPLHVVGQGQFVVDSVGADTASYGTLGVTRAASASTLSYLAMTRSGNVVKAMGIDSSNRWVFGLPTATTQIISTPQMVIEQAGNVGIGTTSPGTKLSVTGDINSTGVLQTRQGTSCIDGTLVYGPGGGTTNNICPAGRYVTLIDGVYAKKSIMYAYSAGGSNQVSYDIDFRCCPCPSGGCSGM